MKTVWPSVNGHVSNWKPQRQRIRDGRYTMKRGNAEGENKRPPSWALDEEEDDWSRTRGMRGDPWPCLVGSERFDMTWSKKSIIQRGLKRDQRVELILHENDHPLSRVSGSLCLGVCLFLYPKISLDDLVSRTTPTTFVFFLNNRTDQELTKNKPRLERFNRRYTREE